MNKIKLFIVALFMVVAFSLTGLMRVDAAEENSVYTISDTTYDEESGKLSYQKITYNKNTYSTMNTTSLDAAGQSTGVSDDAEYVFFPARYLDYTWETKISFKYRNNGVKKIVVHAEYAAGVSKGGVDYEAGYKIICMDALDDNTSWNVSYGKAADGEEVFTIIFGSYANEIYDINLTGFRLYFDYGVNVTEERSFEVLGYEIHESSVVPTFASDPKPIRVSKLRSDDVNIENNTFTVNGTATVTANILDSKPGYEYLNITFRVKNDAKIAFKLDDETVIEEYYEKGTNTVSLPLNQEQFSKLEMVFEATDTMVIMKSFEFKGQPYFGDLGGSGFTVTKDEDTTTVKYNYTAGWYCLSAPIREYNSDYVEMVISFKILQPTLIGIQLDKKTIVNHWSETVYAAGEYEWTFDVSESNLTSDSVLDFYFDPKVNDYEGTSGEKTVIFTALEFRKAPTLPSATVTVDSLFEFDYDGKAKTASGATTNSSEKVYYEYKLEGKSDKYYSTTAPVEVGTYKVRVVSPRTEEHALTYAYSTLVIKKSTPATPTADVLDIDYINSTVSYDSNVYVVSTDAEFNDVLVSGSYVTPGMTLYYKVKGTNNNYESAVATTTLSVNTEVFDVAINYNKERTSKVVPTTVEYSTDGINWITGNGKVLSLQCGKIYLFRFKATESNFAGEITYLAVAERPENTATLAVQSTTSTSVTLVPVEGAQYRTDEYAMQDSNVFTGLTSGSTIVVYMSLKATSSSYASNEIAIQLTLGDINSVVEYTPEVTEEEESITQPSQPFEPVIKEDQLVVESSSEETYIVSTFNELKTAVTKANNVTMITIVINGSINLQSDLTVSGKVKFVGNGNSELVFENNNTKYQIYNSKNSYICFENLTIKRAVVNTTQTYLINCKENGILSFTEVTFDVAISSAGYNSDVDRITYCPSGVNLTLYFNNCIYNTESYFYRGTMIFFNGTDLPKAKEGTVYDFNKFKINYDTKVFRFPATFTVSEDEDFTELVASGTTIKTNTTYYVTDGTVSFEFTTKNLKLAVPTIDNLTIDYYNEKVYFSDKYLVALDSEMTQLVNSGDEITPGATLYVKRVAEGIYFESDVAEIKLPERAKKVELESAFTCSFGFVMEYYPNAVYNVGDVVQNAPVFVGLESGKTLEVSVYIAATDNSFKSEVYQTTITLE